ncbi:hypothetical protein CVT25_014120 [Psilocybe cyanescens]|uniref:Ams2/SPT21 N-terminal domain-containing protein n=1 Tax=Psilocybe cyanescens TaxID=93625 RepID=A0A409XG18_PSICY|nr:hypothetical protein CVT25_014120 [Psilocybe cyanescens]
MMVEKKVSLRVLYTINSSPQYILARSHARVPVDFIPCLEENGDPASPDASKCPPLYANVSLKTCLDTICRSSPELTQDSNRDFSLYVLDPLESNSAPAPVKISNTNSDSSYTANNSSNAEQPRGVAVGLGFMSWALTADDVDATTVVGTLVKQANGQQALEVIFALREVSTLYQRPTHSGSTMQTRSSTADTTRETLASIQMRAKAKIKPPKPIRQSTIPVTESDKFLNAGTYIGPLKKKGRPRTTGTDIKPAYNAVASGSGSGASSHPNDVIVIDGSDSEGTPPTPTAIIFSQSAKGRSGPRKRTPPPPFTTEPLVKRLSAAELSEAPVRVKLEPQEGPSILDILAYMSATSSSEPNAQNAAILAALNTIDSSNTQGKQPEGSMPNPHLVSALKQLLSVYANSAPQPKTLEQSNPEVAKHHRQSSSHAQEDVVVVRDKENVNPVIYQKRAEDGKMKHSDTTMGPSSSPGSSHASMQSSYLERNSNSLGRSSRSNENISQRAPVKDTENLRRKRTLSDFMDEKEKGKGKGKGKERERVEKRDGHRHSSSQRPPKVAPVIDSLRHYPRILASNQPRAEQPANYYRMPLESMTSPARPRPELDITAHNHVDNAGEGSGHTTESRTPSPRPSRVSASSPVRGLQNESRRKYVVPEWARTSTSTQPRLSEEAQRALQEAEERKRQERSAARKRLPSMQAKLKAKSILGTSQSKSNQTEALPIPPPLAPKADSPRGPIIASTDRPMFPATNIHFPFVSSTRSSSPPPQSNVVPKTPKTPIRERRNVLSTPVRENESLFTPMGSGSLFGSARSCSLRTPVAPFILTSPLGNRKKARLTPLTSTLTGKGFGSITWANSSSSAPGSSDPKDMEADKASKKLDRELEDTLDDLECPPSSLPIASSDIDVDSPYLSGPRDVDIEVPVRQHWAGLPPSSPPAPSSPMLLPEHDSQTDDEMDDLPIATSDSEADGDADMNGRETDTPSQAVASPCDGDTPVGGDFSFFSLSEYTSAESEHISSSDLFEQFTNLNDHSDTFPGMEDIHLDPAMEEIFQNGLDAIDLSEFWKTFNFKPLVDESTQSTQERTIGEYFSQTNEGSSSSFGEIDHAKLADEMQTLLSGCLM